FQGTSVVLRLPREIKVPTAISAQYNSGEHFMRLWPQGCQLRYVVYRFHTTDPRPEIETFIEGLLVDATHPGLSITKVPDPRPVPAGGHRAPITLGAYLALDPVNNRKQVIDDFFAGQQELFVK